MSSVALHGSAVVVGSSSPRNFLPWGSGLSVPLTARALGRFAWNPVKPRWNLSRNTPPMSWNTPLTVSPSLRVSTRVLVRLSTATPVATSANLNFVACACQEECTVGTHDFHDDHALWSGSVPPLWSVGHCYYAQLLSRTLLDSPRCDCSVVYCTCVQVLRMVW